MAVAAMHCWATCTLSHIPTARCCQRKVAALIAVAVFWKATPCERGFYRGKGIEKLGTAAGEPSSRKEGSGRSRHKEKERKGNLEMWKEGKPERSESNDPHPHL